MTNTDIPAPDALFAIPTTDLAPLLRNIADFANDLHDPEVTFSSDDINDITCELDDDLLDATDDAATIAAIRDLIAALLAAR